MRHGFDPRSRVWLFTALLSALALGLFAGPIADLPVADPPMEIPWWVMAPAFAITDVVVVHLHVRRDAHAISLMELPLLVGLAMLTPASLLGARLAGGVAALVGHRRQDPTKLLFNLSLFAAEVCTAILLYRWILDGAPPVTPLAWIAAGAAIIGSTLVGTASVTYAIWLFEGTRSREMLKEALTIGVVLPLGTTAVGVLIVTILWTSPAAIGPLTVVGGFLTAGYRGYVSLRQRHTNLQMLHRFTSATARSGETRVAAAEVLAEVSELLRCEIAELTLLGDDGAIAFRIRLVDGEVIDDCALPTPSEAGLRWCRRASTGSTSRMTGGSPEARRLEAFLTDVTVREAIASPLRLPAADRVDGLIVTVNKIGEVSTFDDEDAELLASLSSHAAVALENGRLVERLREEAEEKAYQASHDSLTDLPNRLLLQSRLEEALDAVRRHGETAAVLLMDLDGFKDVNDTLGHAVGDLLLQEVAARLLRAVRPSDTVARLGGDEFAIVLPTLKGTRMAKVVAERIIEILAEPCLLAGTVVDLRASIGIGVAPDDGTDGDTLLQRADAAMYVAKRAGGGTRALESDAESSIARRLRLSTDAPASVASGAIEVRYQPTLTLADGRVSAVEARASWNHPRLGPVEPDEFMPMIEEAGLIDQLTLQLLERALDDVQRWRSAGLDIGVSIDLSGRLVSDLAFPDKLGAVLEACPESAQSLTLEVTEAGVLAEPERAAAVLRRIRDMGPRLSVDDFGTGLSSLTMLRGLPVSELKIAATFVRTMVDNPADAVMVRAAITLGHTLGWRVVAGDVADEATLAELCDLGCDAAQGPLWSDAMHPDAVAAWVRPRQGASLTGRPT